MPVNVPPIKEKPQRICSLTFSLPKFKKKIRSMALKVFCNIEGDLIVVDNWSSPNDETSNLSNNSVSSLYRKPAVRARSGARRSEYSESSQGSCASIRSTASAGRTGVVVRYKKTDHRKKTNGTTTSSSSSSKPPKNEIKMTNLSTKQTTIPEDVNVCQVDLSKALGADLQVLEKLLKQNRIKLSIDNNALMIAQCEGTNSTSQ